MVLISWRIDIMAILNLRGSFSANSNIQTWEFLVENTCFLQNASSENPQKNKLFISSESASACGHFALPLARIGSVSLENEYKTCFPCSTWLIFQVWSSNKDRTVKSNITSMENTFCARSRSSLNRFWQTVAQNDRNRLFFLLKYKH